MVNVNKSTKVLLSSVIGALVVYYIGDSLTYPEGDTNGTGFEEGTPTADIIGIAPLILVALGLYGAFSYM